MHHGSAYLGVTITQHKGDMVVGPVGEQRLLWREWRTSAGSINTVS